MYIFQLVAAILNSLRSSGLDGVPAWLFKNTFKELIKPLTMLINNAFNYAVLNWPKRFFLFKSGDQRVVKQIYSHFFVTRNN